MRDWTRYIGIGLLLEFGGWFVTMFLSILFGSLMSLAGLVLVLIGCFHWTREKGRHEAFMLWGLLSPIGLLGIALLRNKKWDNTARKAEEMNQEKAKNAAKAIVRRTSIAGYQDIFEIVCTKLEQNINDQESRELLTRLREIKSKTQG